MKDKIIKLLEKSGIWMSAGAIAKRLNSNVNTIRLHLLELEKRDLVEKTEAEVLYFRETMFGKYEEIIKKIAIYKYKR